MTSQTKRVATPRQMRPRKPDPASPAPAVNGRDSLSELAAARIAIEGVDTEIDGGRFPAKAVAGKPFVVEADIFTDGHEVIAASLEIDGAALPFTFLVNDRWRAESVFPVPGRLSYTIVAWRDPFATWRRDTSKKIAAGVPVHVELQEGLAIVEQGAQAASALKVLASALEAAPSDSARLERLMDDETLAMMRAEGPRRDVTRYKTLEVVVDAPIAATGAWYEIMPRSQGAPGVHGTFDDVIARLPYVRDLGFDVLYFTPIHPIGRTNRKGPNNTLTPGETDPGSPYAIGSAEGGHDAVHPELGTIEDFDRLVAEAHGFGLKIALDFAIQCSPDHPWIEDHPEWFEWRPDGTIKFAENPPKKYEDIVNVDFYGAGKPDLWIALRDVVLFWARHGVTIFRVDNPHTKPLPFWEWMIGQVKAQYPEAVFLSEAFTRPKVMKRLAKLGFTQSYSYFTWRDEKWELEEYLTELTQEQCRHYMRPNFFANTPDINPYFLQTSGRAGFRIRLVLAATLAGNYGIYNGFEICNAAPVPGKEEYLDSEKYQLRHWDMDAPGHIKDDIRLVNRLRAEHPALADFTALSFYAAHNDKVIFYGKRQNDGDMILVHVCLDPHAAQEFDFEVPLWEFGLPDDGEIAVQDLVHGNTFIWRGKMHRLRIDPQERPYAIWRLIAPESLA